MEYALLLLYQTFDVMRMHHYRLLTEGDYLGWIGRFTLRHKRSETWIESDCACDCLVAVRI